MDVDPLGWESPTPNDVLDNIVAEASASLDGRPVLLIRRDEDRRHVVVVAASKAAFRPGRDSRLTTTP